jgi:hypothetical protein
MESQSWRTTTRDWDRLGGGAGAGDPTMRQDVIKMPG